MFYKRQLCFNDSCTVLIQIQCILKCRTFVTYPESKASDIIIIMCWNLYTVAYHQNTTGLFHHQTLGFLPVWPRFVTSTHTWHLAVCFYCLWKCTKQYLDLWNQQIYITPAYQTDPDGKNAHQCGTMYPNQRQQHKVGLHNHLSSSKSVSSFRILPKQARIPGRTTKCPWLVLFLCSHYTASCTVYQTVNIWCRLSLRRMSGCCWWRRPSLAVAGRACCEPVE